MEPATQPTGPPTNAAERAAPPVGPDLTGRTLGDFHVLRRIGQGGMGQVYLAEQLSLKRKVALKILRADVAANPTSLQRFKAEAEAVARATHANIVQVYAFAESDGQHYMALEYVDGRNLREYLAKKGPPEVLLALSIMRQVAAALQRASELGIIHRDIKPENILLTKKGEVKVADFGLSRCLTPDAEPLHLTASGVSMGTPLYMSPEQVEGKPVDSRTDVYSFGVTCYHMLAGEPPFRGTNAFQVAQQHVYSEPKPLTEIRPDLPAELCLIVHKMMAKQPDNRYQTCRELLRELVRVREGLSGAASGPQVQAISLSGVTAAAPLPLAESSKTAAPSPAAPRRWLPWAMGLSLVMAFAGGAAVAWFRNQHEDSSRRPADAVGVEEFLSPDKREQFLREAVKQYANPKDPNSAVLGLGHRLELGLFYLDQFSQDPRQLDKAEALFKELIDNPHKVQGYLILGRVGYAIVLAYQDKAKESNDLFLKVAAGSQRPDLAKHPQLANNPQLRLWMRKALGRNAVNLKQQVPEDLRYLFKGPPNPPRAGAAERPGERSA